MERNVCNIEVDFTDETMCKIPAQLFIDGIINMNKNEFSFQLIEEVNEWSRKRANKKEVERIDEINKELRSHKTIDSIRLQILDSCYNYEYFISGSLKLIKVDGTYILLSMKQ